MFALFMRFNMNSMCVKDYLTENRCLYDRKSNLHIEGSSTSIFKISSEVEKGI